MSKSLKRVRRALEEAGIAYEMRAADESTRTARQAADALGCEIDQIAKSIVLRSGDGIVLFVTAGGRQVDMERAEALAGTRLERADAALVRARTGFAIGGVSPIGLVEPPVAFWDVTLDRFKTVWAAAGTPHHVFGAAPGDVKRLAGARTAEFSGM